MTWQFSCSTREFSPENTVGKSSSWQAKSNMGLLASCLNPRMWIAEIHWGPDSNPLAFSHCCIMTNNNKYWAGLSPSTSPWRQRKDIYSLGWCLTSRTNKSRIPPGFCPLSLTLCICEALCSFPHPLNPFLYPLVLHRSHPHLLPFPHLFLREQWARLSVLCLLFPLISYLCLFGPAP